MERMHRRVIEYIKGYLAGSRRNLLITEKITDEFIQSLMAEMLIIEKECYEDECRWQPITLVLQTKGGDLGSAYNLGDFIQTLNCPVHGLVAFNTSSAGVDILQMCAVRKMLPSAWLYCHFHRRTGEMVYGDSRIAEREFAEMRRVAHGLHSKRIALYAARTGKRPEDIEKIFRDGEDLGQHIDPHFALELGLIDEIVEPFKIFPSTPVRE